MYRLGGFFERKEATADAGRPAALASEEKLRAAGKRAFGSSASLSLLESVSGGEETQRQGPHRACVRLTSSRASLR